MYQPHNIFAFENSFILYIFVAPGHFDASEFSEFIDQASRRWVPRDVNIYYPNTLLDPDAIDEVTARVQSRFQCDLSYFPFDENGLFENNGKDASLFLDKGKEQLAKNRDPIVMPPAGKVFEKPGGGREGFFLRASNLFIRHAEMAFLALLLIREWGGAFDDSIKTIYVDTIDLYGLVSLACRMRLPCQRQPITVSFSSYSSFKDVLQHADPNSSLMVISATTSHNLLLKIQKKTRWKQIDRVVTILTLDSLVLEIDGKMPKALMRIPRPPLVINTNSLPSIRLTGEKFAIEVDEPRSVVLALRHGECLNKLRLKDLKKLRTCLNCYSKKENERIPLFIDTASLRKNPIYRKWLRNMIEKYAPTSTTHVIHVGGPREVYEPLLDIFNEPLPQVIIPEALRGEDLEITGSVLVICEAFSTGSRLLEISRDLRRHTNKKNVVYFVGFGTPNSRHSYRKLKQDLEYPEYQLRSFCTIPTGPPANISRSWKLEHELLRDESGLGSVDELSERAIILENGKLDGQTLFYRMQDLEFNVGFSYWKGRISTEDGETLAIVLFITVAYILENTRTDPTIPEADSLASQPNRRVLLDPENFFRFNDSLIQVALLRAALPGELDYSDHAQHSASIYYLVKRSEQVENRPIVYELLLAIACGRLRLSSDHFDSLLCLVDSSTMPECTWFKKLDIFKRSDADSGTR